MTVTLNFKNGRALTHDLLLRNLGEVIALRDSAKQSKEAEKIFEAVRLRAPLIEAALRPKIAEVDEEIQMLVDLKEELRVPLTKGGARRDRYFMEKFPFLVRE
jgi:hypothetical protein